MSYILDALRRAESERERGSIPSIHTLPAPVSADDFPVERKARPWPWVVVGVTLGLAVPLAWQWFGREAPPQRLAAAATEPAPAPMAPSPGPATGGAVPGAGGPAGTVVAVDPALAGAPPAGPSSADPLSPGGAAAPSAAPPALPPAAPPAPPAAAAVPAVSPAPAPALAPSSPPRNSPRTSAAARPAGTEGSAAGVARRSPAPSSSEARREPATEPAAAPERRVYALGELPEQVRRSLPQLSVGGSIHSDNSSDRILIINGELFHEGDHVAPDVTLEKIELKRAVLRHKGYRWSLAY